MAKKFKNYYDSHCAQLIAQKIKTHCTSFPEAEFISYIDTLIPSAEFHARQDIFADALEKYLGDNYTNNIKILHKILGPELETTAGMFTYGWWLWPIGRYVERNGMNNYSASIPFIYQLTKRFTGEFAIRTLLKNNPEPTVQHMIDWSTDKNVHVRRLASEGMRLRLPWSQKLYTCINYFEQYKTILTNLKNDNEKFVQKSVGNNLNDLMKEFPEKALEIISEWENHISVSPATAWIIKHGQRSTPVKKSKN